MANNARRPILNKKRYKRLLLGQEQAEKHEPLPPLRTTDRLVREQFLSAWHRAWKERRRAAAVNI
jgi:hypothetical protein